MHLVARNDPALRIIGQPHGVRRLRPSDDTNPARRQLPLIIAGRAVVPDRIEWLRSEMLKTRVAHGYCSRHLAAQACPYANICEQCDNYTTSSEFLPQLRGQLGSSILTGQGRGSWPRRRV